MKKKRKRVKGPVVSGPGESHPRALPEPCVNVSAHTAPTTQRSTISRTVVFQPRVPPTEAVDPLGETRVARPLRSRRITRRSTLLRAVLSLCLALVLWSLWGLHLDFSLSIETTGSQVPCTSLMSDSRRLNAGCRAGSRQVSPALIPRQLRDLGFDITFDFRRFIERFACARLSDSYLTRFPCLFLDAHHPGS